ncbi:TPA: DUF4222 domain-containing protein [Serratia marcescens]|uniref:DUF4222 domain-containing protein n=1 Tax=Serratia bockelmannii TaxID=2703793 RepID=UPI00301D1702
MAANYPKIGSSWRDSHGHIVIVTDIDTENERVIYQRPGYEWDCVCPLFIFMARFTEAAV